MQSFKITKEELLKFAERLYSEGCFGYFDLCEATADRMVTDFLDGREPLTPSILTNAGFPASTVNFGPGNGPSQAHIAVDPAGPPMSGESVYVTTPTWAPIMGMHPPSSNRSTQAGPAWVLGGIGGGPPDPGSPSVSITVTSGDPSLYPPSGAPDTVVGSSSDGIIITETPVIREEVFTRQENYVGNPSERM